MRTESISQAEKIQITTNALLGQAVGDAFGVPAEFLDRKYVQQINLRDMVGCDDSPGFFSRYTGAPRRIPGSGDPALFSPRRIDKGAENAYNGG